MQGEAATAFLGGVSCTRWADHIHVCIHRPNPRSVCFSGFCLRRHLRECMCKQLLCPCSSQIELAHWPPVDVLIASDCVLLLAAAMPKLFVLAHGYFAWLVSWLSTTTVQFGTARAVLSILGQNCAVCCCCRASQPGGHVCRVPQTAATVQVMQQPGWCQHKAGFLWLCAKLGRQSAEGLHFSACTRWGCFWQSLSAQFCRYCCVW